MTLENKFKTLTETLGWTFVNARRDYQNLASVADFIADTMEGVGVGETFLFLDPVIRAKKTSEYIDYSGNFMVLTQSDLDETTYADRKTKYIDPINDILYGTFYDKLRCNFLISDWRSIEVINVFDFNGDGVSMKFTLKG